MVGKGAYLGYWHFALYIKQNGEVGTLGETSLMQSDPAASLRTLATKRLERADIASFLPVDDRVLTMNLVLSCELAKDLNQTLNRITGPFKLPGDGWAIFELYYAARIYGAFGGGIMLRAHGFGREAQFMDRSLYEYYTKMLFYSTFREKGNEAIASFPKQLKKLMEKMKYQPSQFMNEEQMAVAEQAIDYNADLNFKNMRDVLMQDQRFIARSNEPSVNFYMKEARNRWNVQWIGTSQVVHGTVMDVIAASRLDVDDASVTGELDSKTPFANCELLESCQFAFYASVHLESEFGLSEGSERQNFVNDLTSALRACADMDTYIEERSESDGAVS